MCGEAVRGYLGGLWRQFGRAFSSDEDGDGPTSISALASPRRSPRSPHRSASPAGRVRLKRMGAGVEVGESGAAATA